MQELTIFKSGQLARSKLFDQVKGGDHSLSAGVGAGFARITYKGGKWGIRYQGETRPFRRYKYIDGRAIDDGPEPFLDVVIVQCAEHPSKYWYEDAYDPNDDRKPPDCWSSNGVQPDSGAPKKQSEHCVGCKHNVWGSKKPRDDGRASRGKACTDHKRLVVVPVGDIENKAYGGPMLLQVPPTSLKLLAPFENKLAHAGFRFFEVWTRLSFDETSEFPLFMFDAVAPLDDNQSTQVIKMMNDPLIERILTTDIAAVEGYDTPPETSGEPPPANAPSPPPVQAPPPSPAPMPGQVPTPPPADPKGAALAALKTLTPEQLATLLNDLTGEKAAKSGKAKETKARTPTPSPKPQDSSAALKPSSMPPPATTPATTPAANPPPVTASSNGHDDAASAGADDDTAAKILDKIALLVSQSQ